MPQTLPWLGGLTPRRFLREHWQKAPLLVRGAFPGVGETLPACSLLALAAREDVESRVVQQRGGAWQIGFGPFPRLVGRSRLPRRWTLLVQGVNHAVPEAAALLDRFSFIPHARVDDVMVSLATEGGGVGPHFDSYDVFLVQGLGLRRWRISHQRDLALVEGAPLKILQHFVPEAEWLVQPGDMLYLPPRCAHEGVSLSAECTTWSVGFRAPALQELAREFLAWLEDRIGLTGLYEDPQLRPPAHPGELGDDLLRATAQALRTLRWSEADVAEFLGGYLTEAKPQVLFDPPERPLQLRAFAARVRRDGVRLNLRSRMLFRGQRVFVNGESATLPEADRALLLQLADRRCCRPPGAVSAEAARLLHAWYRAGYLEPGEW